MKHPVELYPDFSHLSDNLDKIEKLVRQYNLDIDDAPKGEMPLEPSLSHRRRNLFIRHSVRRETKNG